MIWNGTMAMVKINGIKTVIITMEAVMVPSKLRITSMRLKVC